MTTEQTLRAALEDKKENLLTQLELKQLFSYDSNTGAFSRIKATKGRAAGRIVGHVRPGSYVFIEVGRKKYSAHRLAWLYVHGEFPPDGLFVDHINRDKYDNRIENLRLVNRSQNSTNACVRNTNKCGYKGVYWASYFGRWRAAIRANGKRIYLGYFWTPEAARDAYLVAATKYFGEYSAEVIAAQKKEAP